MASLPQLGVCLLVCSLLFQVSQGRYEKTDEGQRPLVLEGYLRRLKRSPQPETSADRIVFPDSSEEDPPDAARQRMGHVLHTPEWMRPAASKNPDCNNKAEEVKGRNRPSLKSSSGSYSQGASDGYKSSSHRHSYGGSQSVTQSDINLSTETKRQSTGEICEGCRTQNPGNTEFSSNSGSHSASDAFQESHRQYSLNSQIPSKSGSQSYGNSKRQSPIKSASHSTLSCGSQSTSDIFGGLEAQYPAKIQTSGNSGSQSSSNSESQSSGINEGQSSGNGESSFPSNIEGQSSSDSESQSSGISEGQSASNTNRGFDAFSPGSIQSSSYSGSQSSSKSENQSSGNSGSQSSSKSESKSYGNSGSQSSSKSKSQSSGNSGSQSSSNSESQSSGISEGQSTSDTDRGFDAIYPGNIQSSSYSGSQSSSNSESQSSGISEGQSSGNGESSFPNIIEGQSSSESESQSSSSRTGPTSFSVRCFFGLCYQQFPGYIQSHNYVNSNKQAFSRGRSHASSVGGDIDYIHSVLPFDDSQSSDANANEGFTDRSWWNAGTSLPVFSSPENSYRAVGAHFENRFPLFSVAGFPRYSNSWSQSSSHSGSFSESSSSSSSSSSGSTSITGGADPCIGSWTKQFTTLGAPCNENGPE